MSCRQRVEIRWTARAWAWFCAMMAAAWLASAAAQYRFSRLAPDEAFDLLWQRERVERGAR